MTATSAPHSSTLIYRVQRAANEPVPRSVRMSIAEVNVWARWGEACDMRWSAVVRLCRAETTVREGDVVTPDTDRVPGEDASQSVPCYPLQSGCTVFKHAGGKLRALAVEDPDVQYVSYRISVVLGHGETVTQRPQHSHPETCSNAADNARSGSLGRHGVCGRTSDTRGAIRHHVVRVGALNTMALRLRR